MSVLIAHASISENGGVNGLPGDQTAKEVCIRRWYTKPWNVCIRFKDEAMRIKCATAMIAAADNAHIGYSQAQRNTLLQYARNVGYDPGKVQTVCNTDCSALVTLACIYAGVPETALVKNGNSATTRTLKSWLIKTGMVDIFTDNEHLTRSDNLLIGDILLKEGKHVVVVVEV